MADVASVAAVGDDLAPARQLRSPLFDGVRRAVKRVGHEPLGASKVGVPPHIDNNRRRFGAELCIKDIWGNRAVTIVHAQSPRLVE